MDHIPRLLIHKTLLTIPDALFESASAAEKGAEVGSPESIYLNPSQLSTMEIFGFPTANIVAGRLSTEADALWYKTEMFSVQVSHDGPEVLMADNTKVTVGIRSENIKPGKPGNGSAITAKVFLREDLGAEVIVYLEVRGTEWTMVQTNRDSKDYDLEESIDINIKSDALFIFNTENGRRIGRGKGILNV